MLRGSWPETGTRDVLQPVQALGTESSSPTADAVGMAVQPRGDLHVGHPLGRIKDHPRSLHITPRRRDLPRATLELVALVSAQLDHVAARPGHDDHFAAPRPPPSHNPKHFRTGVLAAVRVPRTTTVDLARADGRPFVNAASTGLSVVAARRAHGFKARLGALAYALGALRAGATAQPAPVRVSVDGDVVHDGDAWQVIVAGTGAFGGGSELDAADHGDQRLDVAVVPAGPRLALVRRAWGMRLGGLADQDGVVHRRGRVVEVDGARVFNVDGEVVEVGRPRFAVDGESVRVVVR